MVADASIYGMIKPPAATEGPLDQYGKVLNLRHLMSQGKLQDLQTQQAEQSFQENQDFKAGLAGIGPSGETPEAKATRLTALSPKLGFEYQKNLREGAKDQASIDHTKAQTGDITAGHVAGAWASLAKGGGSDEAVKQVHDTMAPVVGEEKAAAVMQKLLSMPPEMRLPWMTAQAGQHKTGQEALKLFFPQAHMQDTGGQVTPVNTGTLPGAPAPGTPIPGGVPLQKTQSPDSLAASSRADRSLTETSRHHKALEGDPEMIEATAKSIAEGKLAPLSNYALNRPSGQAIMSRVVALNPEFDPTQYGTRTKAEKDFATGKQGNSVRSFNVALSHLDTLDQLSGALNNKDTQGINKFGNMIATQTGKSAPTNFEAAKKIVSDEIVKAIVGSGGGVADREEAAKTISAASSPAQLKGVINTYKELMKGQLHGLRDQYKATTGKEDFDDKYLSAAGRAASGSGSSTEPQAKASGRIAPAKGTVQDGHRFKGGDPSKKENWEKA